ncbi:ATP-dependent DNA ligase [Cupriavidus pauculus]|uniref:ATP-dependent DNA ligase n=1 Tax=Cupriavidus pauculus TaxID=82633 RepID=UPI0012486558|nr:hypothetical protein [Cupriavidus pauculus]KAB0596398.1 hypothetical protein F7R19_27695 [Cupriavidus pauculus]MBY4733389.1 hypothetical protein [Cupriavidus pauculus]UAL03865.1 hypothetical protein K8O84_28515 [Cupriavidus pauculus]
MPRSRRNAALPAIEPMLARRSATLPRSGSWHYSLKFDGYRLLASTGVTQLRLRGGGDATTWFPELVASLAPLPADCVLDGEVVVLDEIGRADFERLHARASHRSWYVGADPVVFCAFDLLVNHGDDVRNEPIEVRQTQLAALLENIERGVMFVSSTDDGEWLWQQVLALKLEGIVAKRAGSRYVGGLSSDWLKIKRPGVHDHGAFKREP